MRRFAVVLGLGGLVACSGSGGSNSVKGVASFDVKTARAVHLDAGGTPAVSVYLSDSDLPCDQTIQTLPDGGEREFNGRIVTIEFPDQGAKSFTLRPQFQVNLGGEDAGSTGAFDPIAVAYFNGASGDIGVGGTIDVKSFDKGGVSGTFDTQTIDFFTYLSVAFSGGHVDSSGKLVWSDGGAVPTESLSGSFDAAFCP